MSRIPLRYWGYLSLFAWGALTLFILRKDSYILDEGAAKSLLLLWSMADQVASSVVTFGTPDLRILLYLPAGFLWTGNVFAAKVITTLSMALTAWLLYEWKQQEAGSEPALIATGLLLISPLTLAQIDTLSSGSCLLLAFALGTWLNTAYRTAPRLFGGWYFAQLFVIAFSVSLHPAGLAYPLALLWSWHKNPLDEKQRKYFFIGIGLAVLFTLLIKLGWSNQAWLQNPIHSLSLAFFNAALDKSISAQNWIAGIAMLTALTIVVLKQYKKLWSDFMGRTLLIGLVIGLLTCDPAWAVIALSIILYFGFSLLLPSHHTPSGGLIHQRGAALLIIFACSTLFMLSDRSHYETRQLGLLPGEDQLIKSLAEEAEAGRKAAEESSDAALERLRVASQWPSRTMIACKCDTLPLPPATKDPQAQIGILKGLTHMLFDPRTPSNIMLTRNLSMVSGDIVETSALLPEGAILHFKKSGTPQQRNP